MELEWMNRCNYGQICNVFGSRGIRGRRIQIRSFSAFEPNTPILSPSRRVYEPEASTLSEP